MQFETLTRQSPFILSCTQKELTMDCSILLMSGHQEGEFLYTHTLLPCFRR